MISLLIMLALVCIAGAQVGDENLMVGHDWLPTETGMEYDYMWIDHSGNGAAANGGDPQLYSRIRVGYNNTEGCYVLIIRRYEQWERYYLKYASQFGDPGSMVYLYGGFRLNHEGEEVQGIAAACYNIKLSELMENAGDNSTLMTGTNNLIFLHDIFDFGNNKFDSPREVLWPIKNK